MNPYEVLEVEVTAGKPKIKRAYRKKAKQHHPDTGGDKQTFQLISLAYETLIDDDKREHFDRTGSVESTDFDKLIHSIISQAFLNAPLPVKEIKKSIASSLKVHHQQLNWIRGKQQTLTRKLEDFLSRIKTKKPADIFQKIVGKEINDLHVQINQFEHQIRVLKDVEEFMSVLEKEPDEEQDKQHETLMSMLSVYKTQWGGTAYGS